MHQPSSIYRLGRVIKCRSHAELEARVSLDSAKNLPSWMHCSSYIPNLRLEANTSVGHWCWMLTNTGHQLRNNASKDQSFGTIKSVYTLYCTFFLQSVNGVNLILDIIMYNLTTRKITLHVPCRKSQDTVRFLQCPKGLLIGWCMWWYQHHTNRCLTRAKGGE